MADPAIAQATDNLVCRMLLFGDTQIPAMGFIEDPEAIATAAIGRLETLGFVGVIELAEQVWSGLSAFFSAKLVPTVTNETAVEGRSSDAPALDLDLSARTLELIEARVSADAIVYRHALGVCGVAEHSAGRLCEATFATQLARLADVAGPSACELHARTRTADELGERLAREVASHAQTRAQLENAAAELQRMAAELAQHQAWLQSVQTSVSWRLTSPLRGAKRILPPHSARAD
ncbi:MAG: hypothetical protein ACRDL5_01435 [Solirubrobacteraceae bacterium]